MSMTSSMPAIAAPSQARLWMPERVMFTPAALDEPWGQQILERIQALGLPVDELARNRLTVYAARLSARPTRFPSAR
jgi:spore photoproduct lyase